MKNISFCLGFIFAAPLAQAEHEWNGRDLQAGHQLYAEQCASCHGSDLQGEADWQRPNADGTMPAPPHDASGHTWHHDTQLLFDYTKLGGQAALAVRGVTGFKSGMPGFADTLKDHEIWDVLAYIRSTWPEQIKQIQDSRNPAH